MESFVTVSLKEQNSRDGWYTPEDAKKGNITIESSTGLSWSQINLIDQVSTSLWALHLLGANDDNCNIIIIVIINCNNNDNWLIKQKMY